MSTFPLPSGYYHSPEARRLRERAETVQWWTDNTVGVLGSVSLAGVVLGFALHLAFVIASTLSFAACVIIGEGMDGLTRRLNERAEELERQHERRQTGGRVDAERLKC